MVEGEVGCRFGDDEAEGPVGGWELVDGLLEVCHFAEDGVCGIVDREAELVGVETEVGGEVGGGGGI